MIRAISLISIALLSHSAWAINKCTGPDGKFVFQDMPCLGKGETIVVKPSTGAGPLVKPGGITEAARLDALTAESQKDRRRWELREQMIPVAQRDIAQHKYKCEQTQQSLAAGQYQYVQNLYGKTHASQIASEMAANAATCDTKSRELKESLDALQAECTAISCLK